MLRPALALAFLSAGCAAPQPEAAPRKSLPVGRAAEVRYVSRLAPAVPVAPPAPPKRVFAADLRRDAEDTTRVRVDCAQYRVDASTAASLVAPGGPRAFALVAQRSDVQRVLDARLADGSMQRASRPQFLLREGAKAELSSTHEQAYVEGFTISRVGDGLIGDPCIATTAEGMSFAVVARLDEAATALEIELTHTELLRPLLESDVRIPSSGVDVVVQVPLALRQELAASALLGPGEVLVLGGILERDGEHDVLVVVDARRDESGAGGAVRPSAP